MRLLKRTSDCHLQLFPVNNDHPPPYAILSHTWSEGQEVTYDELVAGKGKDKSGYAKILFCVNRAAEDGIEYCWVDTCCIDKSSYQEHQTAINSMFRWYQGAARCYAYLSDVQVPEISDFQALRVSWAENFYQSIWFTRGWTLQELLAPANVEFFSYEGKRLGSRISLERELCQITKIPVEALRWQHLSDFSIDERMSWVAHRKTTFKEDKIYCLLGMFGVCLPLIYGEGEAAAEVRLREEMDRRMKGRCQLRAQQLAVSAPLPFPRDELFTGREDELRSLNLFLTSNLHRCMTIYGLGGCGKSALAIEFAYRVLFQRTGRMLFWVPAISRESFELAYREIAVRLRVPGVSADNANIKQLVKDAIDSDISYKWLMIVDNADDPEVLITNAETDAMGARLVDYLPTSDRGKIVFTARNSKVAGDSTQSSKLELKNIGEARARQLLLRRVTNQALLANTKAVDELLGLLAHLPLAIIQAAAFINENNITASRYISLFRRTGNEAELFGEHGEHFKDSSQHREMDRTTAKTWHISFQQIQKQDVLAARCLSFMACIDSINIPQSLLPPHDSPMQQAKAIGTLKRYAFVTERQVILPESASEAFFDVHPLVHFAVTCWLTNRSEQKAWVTRAAARLEELVPHGRHKNKDVCTKYLSHAVHVAGSKGALNSDIQASLLDWVGRCQASLGLYSAAEVAHRQAHLIWKKRLGVEDEALLICMNGVGNALYAQRKFEEAETMYRQTVVMCKKILSAEHLDTRRTMADLAHVLAEQRKYEEAETMYRQTLAIYTKVVGAKHLHTLWTMENLAIVLYNQNKYGEAETMYRQTLAIRKEVVGAEHLDTLTTMGNLADVLRDRCKYEEAETIYRQTLAMYNKVLGAKHLDTLWTMGDLVRVLHNQCKYEEAETMYRQTLAMYNKVLGTEHLDTLRTMGNLARVLYKQRRYAEAEAMYRQTLAMYNKALGAEHLDTLWTMENLAIVLDDQCKYEEAEIMYRQTLAIREEVVGAEHLDTLRTMEDLANMLYGQCKYEEAETMYRQTLAMHDRVPGVEHLDMLTITKLLAHTLLFQGKYMEAKILSDWACARKRCCWFNWLYSSWLWFSWLYSSRLWFSWLWFVCVTNWRYVRRCLLLSI